MFYIFILIYYLIGIIYFIGFEIKYKLEIRNTINEINELEEKLLI